MTPGGTCRHDGPLVGRGAELAELTALLATERQVTLTGPGGVGKTRLASALAADDRRRRCWVELASVTQPASTAQAVGNALGIGDRSTDDAATRIAAHIGDDALLLILDNCEHLVLACARLVEGLLVACPRLHVLATSRETLGIRGERPWPVSGLSVPPAHLHLTPRQAVDHGAVALLEHLGEAFDPPFLLTPDTLPAAIAICRRLDGVPLAIELAAARLGVLGVDQILAGLDDMLRLLVGGRRGAPARHRTLRAALDWSHDLLPPGERALFRRLAVFSGPFDLAAAEAVGADVVSAGGSVADLLGRLVDRSLVQADRDPVPPRYRLLSTVRQYALGRLTATGAADTARRAHLGYYTALAERLEPTRPGAERSEYLDRLELESADLRAAMQFARTAGETVLGLRLAGALWRFCLLRGHYRQGRNWLDQASEAGADGPPALVAKALCGAGTLAFLECDYAEATGPLRRALHMYTELDDAGGVAEVLLTLGGADREQGRYREAERLYLRGRMIAANHGDRHGVARADNYLGFVRWLQGRFVEAQATCERALQVFREVDDAEGLAWSLLSLGIVAMYTGDDDLAGELLADSQALSRSIGYAEGLAWSQHQLGVLALRQGDLPAAERRLRLALSGHHGLGDKWRTASTLRDLAGVRAAAADGHLAARLLGAADAIGRGIDAPPAPCERPALDAVTARIRALLPPESFDRELAVGRAMAVDQLIAGLERASATAGPGAVVKASGAARAGGSPQELRSQ